MASAREYRNLKEYRDKELKWFLLANIILMLIESGVLDFGKLDSISISDISSLLGITAVSSAIYIYTLILDSILPSRVKVFLVFYGNVNQVVRFSQTWSKSSRMIGSNWRMQKRNIIKFMKE